MINWLLRWYYRRRIKREAQEWVAFMEKGRAWEAEDPLSIKEDGLVSGRVVLYTRDCFKGENDEANTQDAAGQAAVFGSGAMGGGKIGCASKAGRRALAS